MIGQDDIVAESLADYLLRHPEMDQRLSKTGQRAFYTTDSTDDFDNMQRRFLDKGLNQNSPFSGIELGALRTAPCELFHCRITALPHLAGFFVLKKPNSLTFAVLSRKPWGMVTPGIDSDRLLPVQFLNVKKSKT